MQSWWAGATRAWWAGATQAWWAGALMLSACGNGTPEMTFATSIAWAPQVDCSAGQEALGANMRAILDIGGHEPCDLQVNSATLTVSGECERITIGIVRPLGLGYWYQAAPADDPEPLAYIIGWVDLGKDSLDERTTIPVALTGDGTRSVQVDTEDEYAALREPPPSEPNYCQNLTDGRDTNRNLLCAESWGRSQLAGRGANFDRDNDTESNLVEACNGTLFP